MSYFECPHCLSKFVREAAFKKHSCQAKKRYEIMQKPVGLEAYETYCQWLRFKGYKAHSRDQFMDSRVFNAFVLFTRFASKMAIPAKDQFIKMMAELDIQPRDWTKKIVYEHYLEAYETLFTPEAQFDMSIDTMKEISRNFECDVHEVFMFIEPGDVLRIVQAKKLSPWFLMNSDQFKRFVNVEMTREQKIILQSHIDPDKWNRMTKKYPNKMKKFRKRAAEMGL